MSFIEMRVNMDCSGCENKIRKALKKVKGVDAVDIDMHMQKVTVMGWADQHKVLKAVRKTGKNVEMWPYPYNPESNNYYQESNNYYGESNNYYRKSNNYFQESNNSYPNNYYQEYYYRQPVTVQTQQPVTYYYAPGKSTTKSKTPSYKYKKQYNYHYKGDNYGYFQRPLYSTLVDEQASSIFSDDNPHACSIM